MLEQLVTQELRDLLAFVTRHEKRFVRLVMDKSQLEQKQERVAKKKAAEKQRRRVAEIDTIIERLYVDNVSSKVSGK